MLLPGSMSPCSPETSRTSLHQLLAPQISGITGQAQQQKNTLAQFGDRSGGNNSKAQTIDDTTRASINDMIAKLTGSAASGLGTLGTSSLGLGLSATDQQAQEAQQKLQNQQQSLLGRGSHHRRC